MAAKMIVIKNLFIIIDSDSGFVGVDDEYDDGIDFVRVEKEKRKKTTYFQNGSYENLCSVQESLYHGLK